MNEMEYCRFEHIRLDAINIPDAKPFIVYKADQTWAFAMRINNQFTLTRFQSPSADENTIMKVKKQIKFCRDYGWSSTGYKSMNPEVDELEAEFHCLYCRKRTFKISEPCPCRNKKIEDLMKKTPFGFILPY